MPRASNFGIFSVVIVVAWSGVYFSTRSKLRYDVQRDINYEDIRNNEMDYDMVYPMDEPSTSFPTTESNKIAKVQSVSLELSPTDIKTTSKTTTWPTSKHTSFEKYERTSTERTTGHLAELLFENLTVTQKRDHVKKMMKHAWDNYVEHAWGGNELKPISNGVHYGSVFGNAPVGATIVDSLDTLHTMGLIEEFRKGRDWVVNNLNIDSLTREFSVFEVNIRLVGGLLTCYSLTGETAFRDKAQQIADKLLPAFATPTGIPHALVDFKYGTSRNYGWASGGSSILSEFGTLHLEFAYLSDVTGNPIYRNKTEHVRHFIQGLEKPNGLYPNYIDPGTGKWSEHHSSMGSLGDSFYEYLLKAWLQSNKEDVKARVMFDEAMSAILKYMLQTSQGGLMYIAEIRDTQLEHKMEHLTCFAGGLLALAAKTLTNNMTSRYMEVAKEITHTCHESYDRTYTKIGPEGFRFSGGVEAKAIRSNEQHYILRPEVVESCFYLYRLTKDDKYRDWGWQAVVAFEKYCRVDGGYTGISDVYSKNPSKDDVQQSFFLSETLKYLYLLFSDDTVFSLDEWVFNTEAHPLPIKGVNPYYREAV